MEITRFFIDAFEPGTSRDHEVEVEAARAAGLDVLDCRNERLGLQFFDVGAIVYFLRKVIWTPAIRRLRTASVVRGECRFESSEHLFEPGGRWSIDAEDLQRH